MGADSFTLLRNILEECDLVIDQLESGRIIGKGDEFLKVAIKAPNVHSDKLIIRNDIETRNIEFLTIFLRLQHKTPKLDGSVTSVTLTLQSLRFPPICNMRTPNA